MYKILLKENLAPHIYQFKIAAPDVARKAQAGQFVIIRIDEKGERIPLTIADWNREEGSITLVFNEVGRTTHKLASLAEGDFITNFVGPLGLPAQIDYFGSVVCVAVGYSAITIIPTARALKAVGNKVISIIRAPTKETLFGEERLSNFSNQLIVVSGDDSCGRPGFILEPIKELLKSDGANRVLVSGPACVMKLVAATTRPFSIRTMANLNPIMIDGTGMCGCCRVIVGNTTKFACVDGPAFDAHEVNWDWLMSRRCTYSSQMSPILRYQCFNCAQW